MCEPSSRRAALRSLPSIGVAMELALVAPPPFAAVLERGCVVQQGTLAALEAAPATPFARAFVRASRGGRD